MSTSQNVPTIRATAIACENYRRVEVMLTTDSMAERDTLISVHMMTVPEARRLYNTLQDALNVIDGRALQS